MMTATIDDGWGHGLEVIEKLATATGVRIHSWACFSLQKALSKPV